MLLARWMERESCSPHEHYISDSDRTNSHARFFASKFHGQVVPLDDEHASWILVAKTNALNSDRVILCCALHSSRKREISGESSCLNQI